MSVKELYEKIHGDYQKALSMMMMDDFIKRMLTKFVQNNPGAQLLEAYDNKDYPSLFQASHSLKGVAGNLALTSIFDKVVPIVEKTRNATKESIIDINKEMEEFRNDYNFVIEELKSFLIV